MNASDLIREVEHAGGYIRAEGTQLKLAAPSPLPPNLIERLKEKKAEIIRLLIEDKSAVSVSSLDSFDTFDWRDWIAERAAILEYDGGLCRTEADQRSFEHALIEWQNRHPYSSNPDNCAGCGDPIHQQATDWRPLADGATVHYGSTWGLQCMERHALRRREDALNALANLGIGMP
jgi:hypothetical protein